MNLDKRIIKGKKPLTRLDAETAVKFLGKECYFSDSLDDFEYLDEFKDKFIDAGYYADRYKGKLLGIFNTDARYIVDEDTPSVRFDYCLPCEWVKVPEKKYRPFDIKEFIKKYPVGSVFQIRQKREAITETCVQYVGYKIFQQKIYLGITDFTLDELFESFEMIEPNGDTWMPFGIEE